MAQGDVFIDGDGKIGIDATGKIRLVDASSDCPDCCDSCTASGTPCANCDDVTPAQYQVTFSGITSCGCEYEDFEGEDQILTQAEIDATFNTLHTVDKGAGSSCFWTDTGTYEIAYYTTTDGSCGTLDSTRNYNYAITIERTATEWRLEITEGDGSNHIIFSGSVAADTDAGDSLCGTVSDISSDIEAGDCGTDYTGFFEGPLTVMAYGGTATVVCV